MKKFLITCIIAMFSAGIYGFIDMSRDIKNGTMIQYEDLSAPKVKAYTRARTQAQAINTSIQEKITEYAEAKKKSEEENKKKLELTNMKFEDFSRGEEIYLPPTDVTTEIVEPETNAKADTAKVVVPPTTADAKQVSEVTTVAVVEEPSLNERMFSRGSPRMYKKTLAKK